VETVITDALLSDDDTHADEKLVPDISRGRGRSTSGDINVGEEGSE
jgi:hypothetical protein